ncbi:hypothetical protein Dsin_012927 [Dipteronia sinensis]|uniref:RNase H type-1 domain-containing protein n=1 Tax=Dipteronia sinensis TaxID=43782 RepID=A0AAE0AJ18_9ROSI|nr:hypothetical protein Dsin_012927 [Dipteronia sinensis]
MVAFGDYGNISDQLVIWGKSFIYFGSSVSPSRIGSLLSLVGMQIGQLPFSYLGVHLFQGKHRRVVLWLIADKILCKFAKWKGKSLSLADLATLIRSVITGSFVHFFTIYKWSSSLLLLINHKLRKFLWFGSCEETKLVRVTWDHCCRPYSQGDHGLKDQGGFSRLRPSFQRASLAINFAWKYGWHRIWLESDSSYVIQLISSRYKVVHWRVRQAWQRCIFQISQIDFQIFHIFKEGNHVADALSKHALELQADSWWFSAPSLCFSLFGNNCMGREFFHFS